MVSLTLWQSKKTQAHRMKSLKCTQVFQVTVKGFLPMSQHFCMGPLGTLKMGKMGGMQNKTRKLFRVGKVTNAGYSLFDLIDVILLCPVLCPGDCTATEGITQSLSQAYFYRVGDTERRESRARMRGSGILSSSLPFFSTGSCGSCVPLQYSSPSVAPSWFWLPLGLGNTVCYSGLCNPSLLASECLIIPHFALALAHTSARSPFLRSLHVIHLE